MPGYDASAVTITQWAIGAPSTRIGIIVHGASGIQNKIWQELHAAEASPTDILSRKSEQKKTVPEMQSI